MNSLALRWCRVKPFTPYIFSSVTSGVIMGAADLISQCLVNERSFSETDKERLIKFASIGVFFTGPLLARWSSIMRKSITNPRPLIMATQKTLLTQIFLAPPLNFGVIILADALNGFMPTKTSLRNILQGEFLAVMEKSYMLWVPVQFYGSLIRFPIAKYALINFMSIIWFAYLSTLLMNY